ncbi:MAG: hypothetical protein ACMG6H_02660 [Acidobacteriota bacterium]
MNAAFHNEIVRRFPEVSSFVADGDEELPYVMASYVVEWLLGVAQPVLAPDTIRRVVDFHLWCADQPEGNSASDDAFTIETVALIERLFQHDELLPLIPHLMSMDDFVANREYLIAWVGADRYEAALAVVRDNVS